MSNITMQPLTLTPGKHYRTRDGKKVRIYATDGRSNIPVHGALLRDNGWDQRAWNSSGTYFSSEGHSLDIIAEWIDRPEGGWEHMPSWIKWRAMDANGDWWAYSVKPQQGMGVWGNEPDPYRFMIHPEGCPTYSGPWTDSLDERPEGGK